MELLVVAPVNWILILKWVRKSGPDFDLCPTLCREVGSPLAFLFVFGSSAFFTLRESRDSELSIRLSAAPAWVRCPPLRHCAGLGAVSGLHVRELPNRRTDIGKKRGCQTPGAEMAGELWLVGRGEGEAGLTHWWLPHIPAPHSAAAPPQCIQVVRAN